MSKWRIIQRVLQAVCGVTVAACTLTLTAQGVTFPQEKIAALSIISGVASYIMASLPSWFDLSALEAKREQTVVAEEVARALQEPSAGTT